MFGFGAGKKKEPEKTEEEISREAAEHARKQRMKKLAGAPTSGANAGPVKAEAAVPDQIMSQNSTKTDGMEVDFRGTQKIQTMSQPLGDMGDSAMKKTMGNMAQPTNTPERLMHTLISDVYHITNESAGSQPARYGAVPKTFLYEFCNDGQVFSVEDLDIILCNRLCKNRDENKFTYLFESYQRLQNHLLAKRKQTADKISEMKCITARYFVTCFSCPDTFDLNNDVTVVDDGGNSGGLGGNQDMQDMMNAMMQGGAMPGQGNAEQLSSGLQFEFTKMQSDIWQAVMKTHFLHQREFMTAVFQEISEDPDIKDLFFETLFEKMHLELTNIKSETFGRAEQNLDLLKSLLDYEGAAVTFVNSAQFFNNTMNGQHIQKRSYLGRYLSFSALIQETTSWRQSDLNMNFHKMRPEAHQQHMEALSARFFALHTNLAEIVKKLMKNQACKERVLLWMRQAVSLNLDKQKMFTHSPVASDGFILNYIDMLLQLCKPFVGNFQKYGNFLQKINCFYLINNDYIAKATDMEKVDRGAATQVQEYLSGASASLELSGTTQNCLVETSSLMGGGSRAVSPPNFITDCFFLVHILISFNTKKTEQYYVKNNEQLNKAIEAKDYASFDDIMAQKLCMDAHIFGKNTIALYRSLFSFTHSLLICAGDQVQLQPETFATLYKFLDKGVNPNQDVHYLKPLAADFQALPQILFHNINSFPKLFKMIYPETYFGADTDLQCQLAGSISVILNRRISNPHMRIEFINFFQQILPQKNVSAHHEKQNLLYKNDFFTNHALKKYLMHALIIVYVDSEKTDYYGKFRYRHASASIMEYIWSDEQYRKKFIELPKAYPEDFSEFCNILINDMNSLLFDGLLALEEIKNHEELKEDEYVWNQMPQEEREQADGNFAESSRKAQGSLQLSNMVIQLLAKVTTHCQDPFVSEELGEKFSQAVNFCLDQLTTQKGLKFKIKDPDRFHFAPKELLTNLIAMYANMAHLDAFKQNVVKDGRSYSDETFAKALKILNSRKKAIAVATEHRERFEALVEQLKSMKAVAAEEDLQFDDAPDEFLDPLMATLMDDPVELPNSHTIIDRLTIKRHLVNDAHDPFNRAPLTLDQVISRPDIKKQIDEYIASKKK